VARMARVERRERIVVVSIRSIIDGVVSAIVVVVVAAAMSVSD